MPGELKSEELRKIVPYAAKCNENGMVNYCRMIFSGKSDYVLSKKELKSENPGIEQELFSTLSTVKKTSGWVSRWLEYICLSVAEIDVQGKNAYLEFCKYIRKPGNRILFRQHFKKYFEELTEFLGVVEKVMT